MVRTSPELRHQQLCKLTNEQASRVSSTVDMTLLA